MAWRTEHGGILPLVSLRNSTSRMDEKTSRQVPFGMAGGERLVGFVFKRLALGHAES